MPRDNGHGPSCFCGCGNGERTRSGGWQRPPRPERLRRSRRREVDDRFGTGEYYATRTHTAPVHGMTSDGEPVTAAFGYDGAPNEGQTFLADGHATSLDGFWGLAGAKRHDDFDGRGGGTQRGMYTGYGS